MTETTGLIGWLNANAGAVTALATVTLAGLTAWYVVLTRQLALTTRETAQRAADAHDATRREAVRALWALVKRLSAMAAAIPVPIQVGTIQRATIWTAAELGELEALARSVEGADLDAVSHAVKGMRFVGRVIDNIITEEKGRGWNAMNLDARDWLTNVDAARQGLNKLAQSIAQ